MQRPAVVVQDRQRLFREALTVSLRHYLDDVEVVDGVPDASALLELARRIPLTHVVLEVSAVPWDLLSLVEALRRERPGLVAVGLSAATRPPAGLALAVLPRTTSPVRLADTLQPGPERVLPFMLSAASGASRLLTEQQLKVLSLLSLGLTAAQVAARLGLSERGVAKSKQAAFAKLGVQTQAEALSAALSTGLLGPPRSEGVS
ncbi:MAG: helix-turn-helix transcriptional regulator [Acidimicrobiales bacterium]